MTICMQGECWKNPKYMVGDERQSAAKGYCRLSCGTCLPADGIPGDPRLLLKHPCCLPIRTARRAIQAHMVTCCMHCLGHAAQEAALASRPCFWCA